MLPLRLGFTFQSLAILAESTRLVLTNILMKQVTLPPVSRNNSFLLHAPHLFRVHLSPPSLPPQLKLDPLSSLYYIAPLCALFIGVACFIFESAELPYERMLTSQFILTMLINGLVSFTLNVAVVLLISNTSALVLTLAGIVKDVLLVCLSVAVFGSPVTLLQYFGYRWLPYEYSHTLRAYPLTCRSLLLPRCPRIFPARHQHRAARLEPPQGVQEESGAHFRPAAVHGLVRILRRGRRRAVEGLILTPP